jgi:ribosome-associated heat shock protein Hsp15
MNRNRSQGEYKRDVDSTADVVAPVRVDVWLWAARFFKTRQLAIDTINLNRVQVNGDVVKPSRKLKIGDSLTLRKPPYEITVVIKGLSEKRGGAPIAQTLYEETEASIEARETLAAQLKAAGPPLIRGRPTKRDRRDLEAFWESAQLNTRDDR